MRYWLTSLAVVLFVVAVGDTQETKKKDTAPPKDPKVDPAKEPAEVMGKSFEQWKKDLKSADPGDREMAMKSVLLFGLNKANDAMPDIIDQMLRHKKISIDLSVRVNGTMAMNTYFLHMKNAKKEPAEKMLKDAIAVYKMFLKDPQVVVRLRAVQGLPYLGSSAHELLDEVITLSRDGTTWELRKEAIPVMVMLASDAKGGPDPKVMLALRKSAGVTTVDETSHLVRLVAVQGLGMLGGKEVIVDMKRVLEKDPSKEVKVMAIQALANAGKENALLELRRAIENQPAKEVRLTAIQALAAAGKEKALPDLRNLLKNPDKEMRLQALNMIAALKDVIATVEGAKANTLKSLNQHLGFEKDPILRIWTHATIMTITDIDKTHMAPVVQQIADNDEKVRMAAFQVISMGGPKSKAYALQPVLGAVKNMDLGTAIAAIETLVHIHANEAVPMLEGILKDAKAPPELKDAAEIALDNIEIIIKKNEKEKKTPDKK